MKKLAIEDTIKKTGIMVIDGAMSTALERLGCDLNDPLWTAIVLAERPELVRRVHLDYLKAGADSGITSSYQATIPGLRARGYSLGEAEKLIAMSVRLFLEAREEWMEGSKDPGRATPLCLGSVGPYGAYLADGSEYRGNYGISRKALKDFHQRRAEILWEEGSDLLLFETQPSLEEAAVGAEIAEEMGADYWISFTFKDENHIAEGETLENCAKELTRERYPHLHMIGANCTAPELVEPIIESLKGSTELPIAVYPNSGEKYDPRLKKWNGMPGSVPFGEYALRYMKAGAKAVGGCCTTDTPHIREVAEARDRFLK